MLKRIIGAIYFTVVGVLSVATTINVIIALFDGYRDYDLLYWLNLTPGASYFVQLGIAVLIFFISVFLVRANPFKTDIEKEKEDFLKK